MKLKLDDGTFGPAGAYFANVSFEYAALKRRRFHDPGRNHVAFCDSTSWSGEPEAGHAFQPLKRWVPPRCFGRKRPHEGTTSIAKQAVRRSKRRLLPPSPMLF